MKTWGALSALALSMFIIVIDTTIMNVSISALVEDLNTTVSGVQAAISIYALVMASFILIGSKLSDIFGRKKVFIVGLIIYGAGTITASFAQTLLMLIIGWSIMEGIGGSLMIPNIQTLLKREYKDDKLAFSYGIIGAVGAVGAALGPIVGGFFTTFFSWRWAFRTEAVIVVIVLILVRYIGKDVLPKKVPNFDFLGAGLSIIGWSSIVLGILLAQKYGFFLAKEPLVIGNWEIAPLGLSISPIMVGFGLIVIMLLFKWEGKLESEKKDGLFRPSLFKIKGLPSGFAVRFFQVGVTAGFLYLVPLMLQLSFDFTAMQTGVALLPFSICMLIMSIVGAKLSAKFYAKRIIQVGFIVATIGMGMVAASIQPGATAGDIILGGLFGAGIGLVASQILNLILSSVSDKQASETAGLSGTFEQLGNAIAVALIGTLMIASLTFTFQREISNSDVVPEEYKNELIQAAESGVQLVSSSELDAAIDEAGLSEEASEEIHRMYDAARTQAFNAGASLLIFALLLALVATLGLPLRKLVKA